MAELEFSFGINNGELDEFKRNQCFVLGFELGRIWTLAQRPEPFAIHNLSYHSVERVQKLLNHYERSYELDLNNDDWYHLTVRGTDGSEYRPDEED